jgi:hypothetical protein
MLFQAFLSTANVNFWSNLLNFVDPRYLVVLLNLVGFLLVPNFGMCNQIIVLYILIEDKSA